MLILSALFKPHAFAQIDYGTIEVIYFSQDKIVIAADSRNVSHASLDLPNDSACKIVALDGNAVFVSSGGTAYQTNAIFDRVNPWTNNDEARIAYQEILATRSTSRGYIKQIAEKWGESIVSEVEILIYDTSRKGC